MEFLYRGNWQYRWGQVPFMHAPRGDNHNESILAHQWSCVMLWMLLRKIMPALNKQVDHIKLHECIALHDIGEIVVGDTPRVEQLKSGSTRKRQVEEREIESQVENLPESIQSLVKSYFHEYTFVEHPDLTILLARYLDSLQANHFGLVYGHDLGKHSELISQIVNAYFVPVAKELESRAAALDPQAGEEIEALTNYHLQAIRDKGIKLEVSI